MLADAWAAQPGAFRTDVALQMQRVTLDIVGLVAFSHDFRQTARAIDELRGASGEPSEASDRCSGVDGHPLLMGTLAIFTIVLLPKIACRMPGKANSRTKAVIGTLLSTV